MEHMVFRHHLLKSIYPTQQSLLQLNSQNLLFQKSLKCTNQLRGWKAKMLYQIWKLQIHYETEIIILSNFVG